MKGHIHIGFGDSATGCLKEAINKFGLPGIDAAPSRDDLTQGPISLILTDIVADQRISYWESVDEEINLGMDVRSFYKQSLQLLDNNKANEVTLWIGDSCHDILATGWIINFFRHKEINFYSVDLSKVDLEDTPSGHFVVNLAMYAPEKVSNLWKYRKAIGPQESNYYVDTLKKVSRENSHYRILERGKILSVGEDYFDDYILSHINKNFEPYTNVIGRILKDGEYRMSDTTVELNLRKMIMRGQLEYSGKLNSLKNYKVRTPKRFSNNH